MIPNTQIISSTVEFEVQPFLAPLHLSSGTISVITEARATVRARCNGREAVGKGSIYLSDLWAWPTDVYTHDERDAILRSFCEQIAAKLPQLCGDSARHPLELGLWLHESVDQLSPGDLQVDLPALARSMCASPFDAAIHDAAGIAAGVSAFEFYTEDIPIPSADHLFPGACACAAVRHLLRSPVDGLDAWGIVGKGDVEQQIQQLVDRAGFRCFKIKLHGKTEADAAFTAEVYQAALKAGIECPQLAADSNQANPDADSVGDYLDELERIDPGAFEALAYLEQPTRADIAANSFDWHAVTARKPVLIDEALTAFEVLELAKEQGWSGLALKTCKGHSFILVAAAWAKANDMIISLQDLTNPGLSAVHAALLAAYVPMCNGVEINSPQFTPAANRDWLPQYAGLFEPKNGVHDLSDMNLHVMGLGSALRSSSACGQ